MPRRSLTTLFTNTCARNTLERYSLKNKLRYVFSHHRELALWEGENEELLCGLAGWQEENKSPAPLGEINRLRDSRSNIARAASRLT